MAAPANLVPLAAGAVLVPLVGYGVGQAIIGEPAIAYPPGQPPPVVVDAHRTRTLVTASLLGLVATGSLAALYYPRAASPTYRATAVGTFLGSLALGAFVLGRLPKRPERPALPPITTSPPPVMVPPPRLPPPPPPPLPPAPTPRGPNRLGCTPLSGILPESALNQATALLQLDPNTVDERRRATAASTEEMRRLANDLRYCGSDLGPQPRRDDLVASLERRALEVEAVLRQQRPASTINDAGVAFKRWRNEPANAILRGQFVTTFRAVFAKDPPTDGSVPPELEGRV